MTPIRKERLSKILVMLIAIIGCTIQMQSTFIAYFTYGTTTRTTYSSPKYLDMMSLSICSPYADILDYKSLKRFKKIDLSNMSRDDRQAKVQELITVREIFDLTPRNDSILEFCAIRSNSTRVRTQVTNVTECYAMFNILKYYTQDYMCYAIRAEQFNIPYGTYSTTIDAPGEVYMIGLQESFSKSVKFLKLIAHTIGLPNKSKQYSASTLLPAPMLFKIRYIRHFMHFLGYPYDKYTCSSIPSLFYSCLESCANQNSIAKYGKIIHDMNILKHYDYMHLSKKDVTDPKISREVDELIEECHGRCMARDCHTDYTTTEYDTSDFGSLVMIVNAPDAPDISITFHPSIKFLDLFVYVMGAVGTWFGVAFMNINPISVYRWFKSKINHWNESNDIPLNRYPNFRRNNQTHPYWWCRVNDPPTLPLRKIHINRHLRY